MRVTSGRHVRYNLMDERGQPWAAHVGGAVVVNNQVWLCNEGVHAHGTIGELVAFDLPRGGGNPSEPDRTLVIQRRVIVDSRASFASTTHDGQMVCVGEFTYEGREDEYPVALHHIISSNTAWVACYDITTLLGGVDATHTGVHKLDGVLVTTPTTVFLTGDGVQGFLWGPNYAILSHSFGFGDSTLQYHDLSLHVHTDQTSGMGVSVPVDIGRDDGTTTTYHAFALEDATMSNKVFAPALSQDLSFRRLHHDGGADTELFLLFESAAPKYRKMVEDVGWSSVDRHVYSMRLPKWRHKARHALYPHAVAIGFGRPQRRPCSLVGGFTSWACRHLLNGSGVVQIAEDQRATVDVVIGGEAHTLAYEQNLTAAEAAFEARHLCAWHRIRDAGCPGQMARHMVENGR